MKTATSILLALATITIAGEPYKNKTDAVIYEATVNNKKIVVLLSEAPFDPDKHEITPGGVVGKGDDARAYWPKVDGHTTAGFGETNAAMMKGLRHLTRLAVSFDGKVVEAPIKLIAHVFLPDTDTTFDSGRRTGMVSISSDGAAVVVDLGVGDGAWSSHEAFTFTAQGDCRLGVPIPPEP